MQGYLWQISQLSPSHECPGICECQKSSNNNPSQSYLSPHNSYTGSQGAIFKIIGIAFFVYKIQCCLAIMIEEGIVEIVMLFEYWFTMKPSIDIFKTNIFLKVLVINKRIIQYICWPWHHRSVLPRWQRCASWKESYSSIL